MQISKKAILFLSIAVLLTLFLHSYSTTADSDLDLISVVGKGDINTVKLLLDKGADVNAKDKDSYTALMYAVEGGRTEIVNLLKEAGAKE